MSKTTDLVKQQASDMVVAVKQGAVPVVGGLAAIWTVSVANWVVFGSALNAFGVQPWSVGGLWHVFTAPFLHGDIGHLMANSVGFLMLAPLTMLRKRLDFWVVTVAGTLSSGLMSWVFGGLGSTHIGVSGVIFAYLGFLMTRGIFQRSWGTLLMSALMFWMFSGLLWGLFPILAGVGISWQGHLGGFLGGVLVARLLGNSLREQQAPKQLR